MDRNDKIRSASLTYWKMLWEPPQRALRGGARGRVYTLHIKP
jgi:hypothetical protein